MIPSHLRTEANTIEVPGVPSHLAVDGLCLGRTFSGIGRYTRFLLEAMLELAPRMRVSLSLPREYSGIQLPPKLAHVESLVTGYSLFSSFSQARWDTFALRRWLQNVQPTLFFQPNFVLPPGKLPCPSVVMIHDVCFRLLPDSKSVQFRVYMDRVVRRALRHADGVLVHSKSVMADLVQLYAADARKIRVVEPAPTGPSKELPQEEKHATRIKFARGGPYFLHLSNFDPRKNVPRVLRAYARYRANGGAEMLILAGEGRDRGAMQELAARLQLHADVLFTGKVSEDDRHALLSSARAFVFPSLLEGYGLPVVEAMSVGTPVLTSCDGALAEAAGGAALAVHPENEKEIQEGMRRLSEDESLRWTLEEAGRERTRGLSWRQTATQTLRCFDEIMRRVVQERNA